MSHERPSRRGTTLRIPFVLLILLIPLLSRAEPGDTTTVRVFDEYLWTWNGSQSRWADFPDSGVRHEKILMHFRLKCPSPRCGEWDYTMHVRVIQHTGRIDSVLRSFPSFRVDGAIRDSVPISYDTTWRYRWDSAAARLDSTPSAPLKITWFSHPTDGAIVTDSAIVWPAGYYNPLFNTSGAVIDSIQVVSDTMLRVSYRELWVHFEVTIAYELGRFITPYGGWFAEGREFDWVYDVTDFASLLNDSTEIVATYDGWSKGSLFSLDFDFIEGIPARDVYRVEPLYSGSAVYGNPAAPIDSVFRPRTITIDPNSRHTTLSLTTTGHGFGGTENAAEFSNKTHWVEIDGVRRFDQHLWRDDCSRNPVYPQAGTWYFSRGGWCPGDIVHPFVYDLTPFVTPGTSAVVDYQFAPYTNDLPSSPASYIVYGAVMYSRGPNFLNDVELMEIRRPTTEFRMRRMNPVCAWDPPVIVIRNLGADTLRSVRIDYGISGSESNSYTWQGRLAFLDTAVVTLPVIPLGAASGTFTVVLSGPNQATDERTSNDTMATAYAVPPIASATVYVSVRTDDYFDDPATTNGIEWEIVDMQGRQLHTRSGMQDRTLYRDTVKLADGCYQFIIYDREIGDGLIPIRGTAGSYLLRDDKGRNFANGSSTGNYLASFGDREVVAFTVSGSSNVEPWQIQDPIREIFVWPNPASNSISIDLSELPPGSGRTLRIHTNTGEQVYEAQVQAGRDTIVVDLSERPAGVYSVQVTGEGATWSRRFVLTPHSEK